MNSAERAKRDAGELLPVADLVARLEPALVPVPAPGERVCSRCRSDKYSNDAVCRPCRDNASRLGGYGVDVLPISMSEHLGRLHDHLRQYKDAFDACVRYRMASTLGGLLVTFLQNHLACIGDWDVVVTVPSKQGRAGRHPLEELVGRIHRLRDGLVSPLVADHTYEGSSRVAAPNRFTVTTPDDLANKRVLLLDDTFTTGGSIQSASYALVQAGASSVRAVAIGRHVNPGSWPPGKELMEELKDRAWVPERCGMCHPAVISPPTLL